MKYINASRLCVGGVYQQPLPQVVASGLLDLPLVWVKSPTSYKCRVPSCR